MRKITLKCQIERVPMTKEKEEKNPIQVADRLFQAMETLASDGAMGLLELSNKLELNKSTTHRVLNSLIYMGYVRQDKETSKYSLSFKICGISSQLLTQIDIVSIARPLLKQLSSEIGETIHLVQRDGNQAVYIDKVESFSNSIRMASKVGYTVPLYCSGVGKALLAQMSDKKIKKIWKSSEIKTLTEHTITDFDTFMNEIAHIRELGYALDNQENELGVRCLAHSFKSFDGKNTYAISISAPIDRMTDSRIMELRDIVSETCVKIENGA